MAMASDKLQKLIKNKEKSIASIDEKIKELQDKRKSEVADLQEYRAMESVQKFNDLAKMAQDKGLSIEAIMAAVQSGDFFALQEQVESKQNETEEHDEVEDGSYE